MARIVIKVHIKVILFLIKRFEITNGLIVALSAEALTLNINLNIWIRVIAFILITVGCILLQYVFIPARIMFGAFSSILLGAIAYTIFKENTHIMPFIPMIIVTILTGLLNWFGWKIRIDSLRIEDEKME
jgi:hypothetical protein